ncbi:MAG: TonB-dependent receptor [Chitinophagaceae bacterium]|nr:TonB-dependent receptor [Chitinophagaceae bacterium]
MFRGLSQINLKNSRNLVRMHSKGHCLHWQHYLRSLILFMLTTPLKKPLFFLLSLASFLVFSSAIKAQETTSLKIRLITAGREALPFVTIEVLRLADTTNVLRKVSDSTGTASFKLNAGNYIVRVSPVNYKPIEKGITVKNSPLFITLTAESLPKNLEGVVVTSRKPLMRQEDDKTIVDPENLASSSTNAYEIMEKIPGLFVDQDGNIYLSSTTPATIYINGREQKMSASDVATMLKSLPPNAIASIEILRTPSAKYDASGSGGIVNVVLKKGVRIGLTGSVTAGMNQGRYGNQFLGFNLNNNNGSLTSYLNVQYSHRKTYEQVKTDRHFAPDSLLSQDALTLYPASSFYAGYGAAYQLNKKWEISFDGRFGINNSHNSSNNPSVISKISTGAIITSNNASVNNSGSNLNTNESVSLKYKMDSIGSEWSTDVSYTYAPVKNNQSYYTVFYQPALSPQSGDGNTDNRLHFFSAQSNFIKKFAHQFTFETGVKTSDVSFDGKADYFRNTNGTRAKDNGRTSAYHYTENIHSAYLQGSKSFSGIVVKLGVRAENTNMKGKQIVPSDTSFTLKRTDLFPYIYISRSLMKIMGYDLRAYLVYRRTITRPGYDNLNPFSRYVDHYLSES